MTDLSDARARLGLSLEEASRRTRIPQRYLEALEKGDHSPFPPGPFLSGYTRQYRNFLGLPTAEAPVPRPPVEATETAPRAGVSRRPRRWIRPAAVGGAAFLALLLLARVAELAMGDEEAAIGEPLDQSVTLTAGEPVAATVEVDGRVQFDGTLPAGTPKRFEAHDRIAVELATLEAVSIRWNDKPLKPLGAQGRPRRLVFVDDAAE